MRGNRARTWRKGLVVVCGVLVLLAASGLVGWRLLVTFFQHQYYRESYAPIALTSDDIGDYPASHHLDDVPWIATREWYCQANSLAMVAAQHGIDASTDRCSFLMGFTYGAVEVPGSVAINPFTDPEHGFIVAAPYLGLARRYYVTDDETLYLDALRHYISQGYAVRVALDVAVFYDLESQLPHSDLLVGYDETGFTYYETVCLPGVPCEPCQRLAEGSRRSLPPGEEGLWVSDQTLLDAVLGQAEMFSYPWRYSLTVFEAGPVEDDLGPIWTRNGDLLMGGTQYGPRQGAGAVDELAARIEKRGVRVDVSDVRWGLEAAVFTRRNNAAYLRTAFAAQTDVEHAAELFDQATDAYARALASLEDGIADQAEADQIAAWLRAAAVVEREVGKLFLARGEKVHQPSALAKPRAGAFVSAASRDYE
jgi:hypothetical protein